MKNNRLDEKIIGTAKVTVDILTKGYGIPNVRITPTSLTIHNTGNNNASAKANHNYMKNINKNGDRVASWHFTVDDKEIYQAQSTNFKCYHAGDKKGNNTSIGIEICQFTDADRQLKAYKNAIELVKILMKYHGFSIDIVKQHNYWSGKDCPQLLRANKFGYSWNWFINECKNEIKPVETVKNFAILYSNDADRVGAEILSWGVSNSTVLDVKNYKGGYWGVIAVGGKTETELKAKYPDIKITTIKGVDRYDTVRNCLAHLNKL